MILPTVTMACSLYDRILPLYLGETTVEGFDLRIEAAKNIEDVRRIFDNVTTRASYDIAEMSISEFMASTLAGTCEYVGLPVFPSRIFRTGFVFIRTDRIETPEDLAGKKIGVPLYGMTAAVFARGFLADEYGVDFARCEWVQGAMNSSGTHGKGSMPNLFRPVSISSAQDGASLDALLTSGAIDATLGALVPDSYRRSPVVDRLFPDYRKLEADYYTRTSVFPIMHIIVVRKATAERYPDLVQNLYDAFCRSKAIALTRMKETATLQYMLPWLPADLDEIEDLFAGDPWAYGRERNAPTLDAVARYLFEQGIVEHPFEWRDLLERVDDRLQ